MNECLFILIPGTKKKFEAAQKPELQYSFPSWKVCSKNNPR